MTKVSDHDLFGQEEVTSGGLKFNLEIYSYKIEIWRTWV